jgi:hypothetical protein
MRRFEELEPAEFHEGMLRRVSSSSRRTLCCAVAEQHRLRLEPDPGLARASTCSTT